MHIQNKNYLFIINILTQIFVYLRVKEYFFFIWRKYLMFSDVYKPIVLKFRLICSQKHRYFL